MANASAHLCLVDFIYPVVVGNVREVHGAQLLLESMRIEGVHAVLRHLEHEELQLPVFHMLMEVPKIRNNEKICGVTMVMRWRSPFLH